MSQPVRFSVQKNVCPKHFSFQQELSEICSKMYFDLHVNYRLVLSNFDETSEFVSFLVGLKTYQHPGKGADGDLSLLGCYPVLLGEFLQTFR